MVWLSVSDHRRETGTEGQAGWRCEPTRRSCFVFRMTFEAMKMETALHAERDGTVETVHMAAVRSVEAKDLLLGSADGASESGSSCRSGGHGEARFGTILVRPGHLGQNTYAHIHTKERSMTRWNLVIADDTDRHVRSYLARTGGRKGDLSRFVDRAVRQAIFWETVESIWERNRHLSSDEAQRLADEAVAQVRANRS